jgi:predicted RNase H-like HicB family nuclease
MHCGKALIEPAGKSKSREIVMRYKVILEASDEGFAVSDPGLPGCHSQGLSEQEALDNIRDALRDYLEVIDELGRDQLVREVEVEV